jgi:hypothetical protein
VIDLARLCKAICYDKMPPRYHWLGPIDWEDASLLRMPLFMLLVFALTLFLSATLLFLVEPMVGKMILPLLGGTPAVWNTCMVFFQAVLLAGYAYAHASTRWLGPRKQAILHLAVLVVPFIFFPLRVNSTIFVGGEDNPIWPLLWMLTIYIGVPLFVVCTSAPLLQRWFAATAHPAAHDPYFLYGASNLGSMLALLGYPVLVEPLLRVQQQAVWWAAGYAALALLTLFCAVLLWRWPSAQSAAVSLAPTPTPTLSAEQGSALKAKPKRRFADKVMKAGQVQDAASAHHLDLEGFDSVHTLGGTVTPLRRLRWVLLAMVPSSLMLGATTYITTDIAAIPLLWVLPLALYLLTFIVDFSHWRIQNYFLAALTVGMCLGLAYFCWRLPEQPDLELLKSNTIRQLLRVFAILVLVSSGVA